MHAKKSIFLTRILTSLVALGALPGGMRAETGVEPLSDAAWGGSEILARISAPSFPPRTFSIADFGALPGADATAAIRAAVEACGRAGGGRVLIPPGAWITGAITLVSNVDLHVSKGAVLRFSTDPSAYPDVPTRFEGVECVNYSPLIYAASAENVAVTGEGTLDGQASGENWWGWTKRGARLDKRDREELFRMGEDGVPVERRVFGAGHHLRPSFIEFLRCRRVLVEGVRIVRSPMWEIHPVLSQDVIVRGVDILSHGTNNDGCDPECCRDVLIDRCVFDTGDDCIAIKSGRNNDGRRVGVASEDILVRGCTMRDGHGGVTIGSEISGGCRNVYVEDCLMDSPILYCALRIKSNAARGGVLENIFMRNVQVGRVSDAVLTVDLLYEEGSVGGHLPVVRNIWIGHVTSQDSPRVVTIGSFAGATVSGIHIRDSVFRGVVQAESEVGAGPVDMRGISIGSGNPAPREP